MPPEAFLIAAIDAGSPANVGWAIYGEAGGCGQPDLLIDAIHAQLRQGGCVALGIEAPLWFPAGRPFDRMTASREGIERRARRPWSAGAGTGAMAAGLANLTWLLERLERGTRITTQPERLGAAIPLLIWEAFVSGTSKAMPRSHEADARRAANIFAEQWPALRSLIPPASPAVNLAAAVITATRHMIEPDEFGLAIPVIGPKTDALDAL